MSGPGTREKILGLIDDIELLAKELFENTISSKNSKLSGSEHTQICELLVQKDKQLKDTMKIGGEQGEIDKKILLLQAEVDRLDDEINMLQKQLKEAEQLLATAIYQAKQKLSSISKANKRPISSEDLIKYAHRISSTSAVVAPLSWQQGDPRRPYPTDMEMRMGLLGRMNEMPVGTSLLQANLTDGIQRPQQHGTETAVSAPSGQFSWHSSDIHVQVANHTAAVGMESKHGKPGEPDDVEVMSTDSSSSSSSDSQ